MLHNIGTSVRVGWPEQHVLVTCRACTCSRQPGSQVGDRLAHAESSCLPCTRVAADTARRGTWQSVEWTRDTEAAVIAKRVIAASFFDAERNPFNNVHKRALWCCGFRARREERRAALLRCVLQQRRCT